MTIVSNREVYILFIMQGAMNQQYIWMLRTRKLFLIALMLVILNIGMLVYFYVWVLPSELAQAKTLPLKTFLSPPYKGTRVAYIKLEEIEKKYILMQKVRKDLEQKEQANQVKLSYLSKKYQSQWELLDVKRSKLSTKQIKELEASLFSIKNAISDLKLIQDQELKVMQSNAISEVKNKIQNYLAQYHQIHQIDYIIADDVSFIYYKNPVNNITDEIIKELNKEYQKTKQP